MISDIEACLQMAPFLWCFGVLKVDYVKKIAYVFNMSDLSAKMVAQRFTTDEVIRFIMDIPDDGVESSNKTCLERRGMLSLTQPMSMVVTVIIQKKVLRR